MDNEFIIELWDSIKPYIPAKERLNAADTIVSIIDAHGMGDDLESSLELPTELRAAVISHYDIEPEEEDEEEW